MVMLAGLPANVLINFFPVPHNLQEVLQLNIEQTYYLHEDAIAIGTSSQPAKGIRPRISPAANSLMTARSTGSVLSLAASIRVSAIVLCL